MMIEDKTPPPPPFFLKLIKLTGVELCKNHSITNVGWGEEEEGLFYLRFVSSFLLNFVCFFPPYSIHHHSCSPPPSPPLFSLSLSLAFSIAFHFNRLELNRRRSICLLDLTIKTGDNFG